MVKRLTVIFVVSLFVMLIFAGGAFAATAKKTSDATWKRHISEDYKVDGPGWEAYRASSGVPAKYRTAGVKYQPDCTPDPDDPVADPTEWDMVDPTWYEFQQNGSMGRMISVTDNNFRHISWMRHDGPIYPPGPRYVMAKTKKSDGTWNARVEIGPGTINSGYSNQANTHDGRSVVIFHSTAGIGGQWSSLKIADSEISNNYPYLWDLPDTIENAPSGERGAWPKGEVGYDAILDRDYIHIVETEGNTTPGAILYLGYLRCYEDPADGSQLICQTCVRGVPQTYVIPAGVNFNDTVGNFPGFMSCDISAIPVTGKISKKVAIVWLIPNELPLGEDCNLFSDVAYIEADNNGEGWVDGTDWPPTVHRITNFGTTGDIPVTR